MEHAAPVPEEPRRSAVRALAGDLGPKLFITLFAAVVTALLIPSITGKWQDHKQQIELRTTLATQMSRAYTGVIVTGRFVAGGLVYSGSTDKTANAAFTQQAWTAALHEWLVESGTIGAQLTGRYGAAGMAADWREFSKAVTRYMRLGSVVPAAERARLLAEEKAYVGDPTLGWKPLGLLSGFKRNAAFRASYAALGAWLVGRGDELVEEELTLKPRV